MSEQEENAGLRDRLTSHTEDALGKLAQDLLENQLINGAISRAFDARDKAVQAQQLAMGALNLPSAGDIERLTRRVRSVSQRLEGIEDGVDRLDQSLGRVAAAASTDARLTAIEEQLDGITRMLSDLRERLPETSAQVGLAQERLRVEEAEGEDSSEQPGRSAPVRRAPAAKG